jgi:CheY-like chemotaxis protein
MIDDDPAFLSTMGSLLEQSGCRVLVAPNATKGVEVYRHHNDQIDVVLLDYLMPGMDGLQAYQWLHKINPAVKVILLSGAEALRLRQFYTQHPVEACLRKPAAVQDVLQAIEKAAAKVQRPAPREEEGQPVDKVTAPPRQSVSEDEEAAARLRHLMTDLERCQSELSAVQQKRVEEEARRKEAAQDLQRLMEEKAKLAETTSSPHQDVNRLKEESAQLTELILVLRKQVRSLKSQKAELEKSCAKKPSPPTKRKSKARQPATG